MKKLKVDITQVRWTEVNGSVFTEDKFEVQLPFKKEGVQLAVAFNVGRDVARHIVDTHNRHLQ